MSDSMKMPDFCNRRSPFRYTTAINTLAKMGIDANRVGILAVGEYDNYRGEVIGQTPPPGTDINKSSKIVLEVGFPSAVDQMPYQFFYGFEGRPSDEGDWEVRARKLMAPFDASVVRSEALASLLSLVFRFGSVSEEHIKSFLGLYDFELAGNTDDIAELLFWASLLPLYHHWAGNPDLVARIVTSLFGHECRIVENASAEYVIPEQSRYRLGREHGRLGYGSLAGGSFRECDSSYEVRLTNVRDSHLADLLPGKAELNKLQDVIRFCMPSNLRCEIRVSAEKKRVQIGAESGNCLLGYSSYI